MKLLAANMWPAFTFTSPTDTYQNFLAVGRPRFKSFLESLLLYDEIHVPTDNFMSLALLVGVLGEDAVHSLLDSGALKFLRFKGAIAYIGNGGGLSSFEIGEREDKKPTPMFGPMDGAVDWALSGMNVAVDKRRLAPKVLSATQEVPIPGLLETVKDRTYRTILASTELRKKFAVRNTDMNHLVGINPDQVRVYGGYEKPPSEPPDEIATVLLIARSYLEAVGAEKAECSDVNTATPVGYVIAREEASKRVPFSVLQQVADIPDVGESILSHNFGVTDILKLRESRHWPEFQTWFHEKCSTDPISAAKAYIDLLKQVPTADTVGGRSLRFLITTALGFLGPVAGIAAAATDTFLVPKVHKPSARFFIEELEQLTDRQKYIC